MQQIQPNQEEDVFRLKLAGFTNDEIHQETGLSTGTISNVINKQASGLVKGEINAIVSFSRQFRNNHISLAEASEGVQLSAILKRYNLNEQEIHTLLSEIYPRCKESDLEAADLVKTAKIMIQMQDRSNVSLQELGQHCQDLVTKIHRLEDDIKNLDVNKLSAEKDCKSAILQKDLTLEKIDEYMSAKNGLEEFGIDMDELPKVANMIRQGSLEKYDITKIYEYTSREDTFETRCKELEEIKNELSKQEESKKIDVKKLDEEIKQQKSILDELEKFSKIKVGSEQIIPLYNLILSISNEKGLDSQVALEKFSNEIEEHYDAILGLEHSLNSLKERIAIKSEQLVQLTKRQEEFNTEHSQRMTAINIIRKLKKDGIGQAQLSEWNKVLESSGVPLLEFDEKINRFGNLEKTIANLDSTKEGLENEIIVLEAKTKTLSQEKLALEASLSEIRDCVIKSIELATQVGESSVSSMFNSIKTSIGDLGLSGQNSINSVGLESINIIKQVGITTLGDIQMIINSMDSAIVNLSATSEKFGKISSLQTLYELIIESTGKLPNVFVSMKGMLESFRVWLKSNNSQYSIELIRNTDYLIGTLQKEVRIFAKQLQVK